MVEQSVYPTGKTSYYMQPEAENIINSVQWQLENDDVIMDLIRDLQCFVPVGKNKWERFSDEPLINKRGIAYLVPELRMVTSKMISLGNMDDDRWSKILYESLCSIDQNLVMNYISYGIRKERIGLISSSIKKWVQFNSSRALGGKEAARFAIKPHFVEKIGVSNQGGI